MNAMDIMIATVCCIVFMAIVRLILDSDGKDKTIKRSDMKKMTKEEKEKLNEFRDWLISETEKYQQRANNPDASVCGKHYDRGQANGFILARGKLEKLFDLWDN